MVILGMVRNSVYQLCISHDITSIGMTDKDLDSTSGTRMEERHAHGKLPRMYTTQVAPLHDKRNTYCDLHIHQQSHMNHKQNQIHSPYLTDYASPTKCFKRPCGAVSLITVSLITVLNHQPSLEPVNFTLEGSWRCVYFLDHPQSPRLAFLATTESPVWAPCDLEIP